VAACSEGSQAEIRPCLAEPDVVAGLERQLAGRSHSDAPGAADYPIAVVRDSTTCRAALAGIGAGAPGPREEGYVFHLEGELQGYAVAFPGDSLTFYFMTPEFRPLFTVGPTR
jgi:hypothetical protein